MKNKTPIKLSCTPISFQKSFRSGEMKLREFVDYCAEQDLEGVDLLDSAGYPWLWQDGTILSDCSRWAREAGLEIAAFACGNNFAKIGKEERQAQVALVCAAIDRAAECGAPSLRIFGGYHKETGGDPQVTSSLGLELILDGIGQCLPHAEARSVILCLENHGRLPGHSHESLAIIEYFNSPWLKAAYDAANYHGNNMDEDEDPLRAYENLRGQIAYAHLKDVWPARQNPDRRREPCIAGKGITPLRQVIAAMTADGYPGFCSLEFEASAIVPEIEGVTESLTYLKEARTIAAFPLDAAGKLY